MKKTLFVALISLGAGLVVVETAAGQG